MLSVYWNLWCEIIMSYGTSCQPLLWQYEIIMEISSLSSVCHFEYSFSQSLWYISQIRIEILKTTCSISHHCVTCAHKKKSLLFLWTIASALVHPCKILCIILCSILHCQLLMSCLSKCILMGVYWIVSPPQHLGISSLHKFLHAKWLNKMS